MARLTIAATPRNLAHFNVTVLHQHAWSLRSLWSPGCPGWKRMTGPSVSRRGGGRRGGGMAAAEAWAWGRVGLRWRWGPTRLDDRVRPYCRRPLLQHCISSCTITAAAFLRSDGPRVAESGGATPEEAAAAAAGEQWRGAEAAEAETGPRPTTEMPAPAVNRRPPPLPHPPIRPARHHRCNVGLPLPSSVQRPHRSIAAGPSSRRSRSCWRPRTPRHCGRGRTSGAAGGSSWAGAAAAAGAGG